MPNHVTNDIVIIGTDKEVLAVKKFMGGKENPFDFNAIAKIPKILEGTKSPMTIISQAEYDRQELVIEVFNKHKALEGDLLIVAMNEDLPTVLTESERNQVIYFGAHGYSRCLTLKLSNEAIKEFGDDNWYDWQCGAWGTKWNSYSHWGLDEGQEGGFGFQTAWSHPTPIIQGLSEKFPNLQFDIRFADEDTGQNVGEYSILGGDLIETNFPEGGSIEAYELALDISGSEYEMYDAFDDYEEDEANGNTYIDVCFKLAIKNETMDEDLPLWVLHRALEDCVDDENFEYADKLKGFIALAEKEAK